MVLSPTRELEFLGFRVDSSKMLISLPRPKMHSGQEHGDQGEGEFERSGEVSGHNGGGSHSYHPSIPETWASDTGEYHPGHERGLRCIKD
jgi:hypothetical protein